MCTDPRSILRYPHCSLSVVTRPSRKDSLRLLSSPTLVSDTVLGPVPEGGRKGGSPFRWDSGFGVRQGRSSKTSVTSRCLVCTPPKPLVFKFYSIPKRSSVLLGRGFEYLTLGLVRFGVRPTSLQTKHLLDD